MPGQLTEAFQDQLEQWIGTGPKKFDLLYAITRDGCSNNAFHEICDNQGPTVTVLYNQYGSVFGGYTRCSWTHTNRWIDDPTAFLFRLQYNGNTASNMFPCMNSNQAVYCHKKNGPTFGNQDLHTFSGSIECYDIYGRNFEGLNRWSEYDDTWYVTELENSTRGYFQLKGRLNLGSTFDPQGVSNNQINNGTMNVTELEVYKVSGKFCYLWFNYPFMPKKKQANGADLDQTPKPRRLIKIHHLHKKDGYFV